MNSALALIFFFLLGAIVGSFLNAVIYRVPRKISIALPRSKCPGCNKTISWHENIPILSYLFLKGKCSSCDFKIPLKYFFTELILALACLYLGAKLMHNGDISEFVFKFLVFACFYAHFLIDLEHQILPDSINFILAILFLWQGLVSIGWKSSLIGGGIGFGFPLFVTWAFYKLKGKIGLGGGDIKLFGALGLFIGVQGIIQNIFFSCFLGTIVALTLIGLGKMSKDNPIPFGPSIIVVAFFQIFFPEFFNTVSQFIFS